MGVTVGVTTKTAPFGGAAAAAKPVGMATAIRIVMSKSIFRFIQLSNRLARLKSNHSTDRGGRFHCAGSIKSRHVTVEGKFRETVLIESGEHEPSLELPADGVFQ